MAADAENFENTASQDQFRAVLEPIQKYYCRVLLPPAAKILKIERLRINLGLFWSRYKSITAWVLLPPAAKILKIQPLRINLGLFWCRYKSCAGADTKVSLQSFIAAGG